MADASTKILGVPVDAKHIALAVGGGAAMAALGPAVLALPVIAEAAAATGLTLGPGGLAAIGGYLAAKNLGDDNDPSVANVQK
jgi:hypothetical protein